MRSDVSANGVDEAHVTLDDKAVLEKTFECAVLDDRDGSNIKESHVPLNKLGKSMLNGPNAEL